MMYKGKKIYLSPILDEDIQILFDWINNKELVYYNSSYKPIDYISHMKWFDTIRNNEKVSIFGIRKDSDNELIGSIQLHSIDLISKRAELQIRIGNRTEHGKGYGKEAVELLADFAKNDLNLRKIYLYVFGDNERAKKLYLSCAFKETGILKEHSFINGEWKDLIIMERFL